MIKVAATILTCCVALSACSQKRESAQRWRTAAPQKQSETGIILHLEDVSQAQKFQRQIANLMQEIPNLEARAVDPRHSVYEFYNISEADLLRNFKGTKINSYQNVIVSLQKSESKTNKYNPVIKKETLSNLDYKTCLSGKEDPVSVIAAKSLQGVMTSDLPVINLKSGPVSFSAVHSQSQLADKKLERLWVVQGPAGSLFEHRLAHTEEVTFRPDLPGSYTISLLVQDTAKYCGEEVFTFGVTNNQAFSGPKIPRDFNVGKDSKVFFHLNEVGAIDAWKASKGKNVLIAIVDSGVNYNHPDLSANIYVNTKEIPGNHIDDDGNGFVDDTNGWDFVHSDEFPLDDNSHGTHVAGIAASAVTGVAPNATILPVKVMSALGSGDIASITAGLRYAADKGAAVINYSIGRDTFGLTKEEIQTAAAQYKKVFDYVKSKGAIVVVAAGNGFPYIPELEELAGLGFSVDKYPVLPASLKLFNMVTVASVDSLGFLASYSNFGLDSITLAAPGGADNGNVSKPIVAAYYLPEVGSYIGLQGTSMATPVVTGAIAVMKSAFPKAGMGQIITALQSSVTKKPSLNGKVQSGGVLNIPAALAALAP